MLPQYSDIQHHQRGLIHPHPQVRFLPEISLHTPVHRGSRTNWINPARSLTLPLPPGVSVAHVQPPPHTTKKLSYRQQLYKYDMLKAAHSAKRTKTVPVLPRTKTFEDTLLPTHNIFFAGRPPEQRTEESDSWRDDKRDRMGIASASGRQIHRKKKKKVHFFDEQTADKDTSG